MDEISSANISRLGDKESELVGKIQKEYDHMEFTLRTWKTDLIKYYELYKMYQRIRHYDGLAHLFVPEILRAVETYVATAYKMIFTEDPVMEYQSRSDGDPDEIAAAAAETELVNFQIEQNNFKMKVQDCLRQQAIAGLTVAKVCWDFEQIPKRNKKYYYETSVDQITGKEIKTKILKTADDLETVRDHWSVEPVDLIGLYISDVTTPYYDIRRCDWIAQESKVKMSLIKRQLKKHWLADNHMEEIHETNTDMAAETERLHESLLQTSGYKTAAAVNGILVYERWGLLEAHYVYDEKELEENQLEPDDLIETVVVVVNKKYIMKLAANPYWHGKKPFVSCPYVPQVGEFAGIGMAKIGASLQEELNDTRNQVMDNKTLVLMNMWLKSRSSGIKNQDLRIRPLGVIQTNDMNGLKPLAPPIITGVGVNIEGVVKNDLRESVGAPSNLQGIAQSGVSTATESTEINSQAMGRIGLTISLFTELFLKPLFYMADELNAQFYNEMKIIKVIGESGIKWVKRTPEDIISNTKKEVIIKLATDGDSSPSVKRQQLLQFMTIVQNIPPQALPMYWRLLNKIYKGFFPNGHDLSDIFPDQEPPSEEPSLDPSEERDPLMMGKHVKVRPSDDDEQHIQEHMQTYDTFKYALSDLARKQLEKHILDHHKQMASKIDAQRQQIEAQQMMQEMAQQQNGKGKQAAGQAPNMSAFTQTNLSKAGNIRGGVGA